MTVSELASAGIRSLADLQAVNMALLQEILDHPSGKDPSGLKRFRIALRIVGKMLKVVDRNGSPISPDWDELSTLLAALLAGEMTPREANRALKERKAAG